MARMQRSARVTSGQATTRSCDRNGYEDEHGMHVARRQQFPLPRLDPAQSGVTLALRAVPVSARVIRGRYVTAV